MSREAKMIAQFMCDITRDIVWSHARNIADQHGYLMSDPLVTRIGSGRKTYHTRKPVDGVYSHQITYGVKAIFEKKNFTLANGYATTKEIGGRGFFNGEINYANLIAHTIIHESTHALQTAVGQRLKNSVHNKHFYKLLKELSDACDQEVLNELNHRATKYGISLEFTPGTYDITEEGELTLNRPKLQAGSPVSFATRDGQRNLGVIDTVGKSKTSMDVYQGQYKGQNVNVPNHMICSLEPDDPMPDPKDIPKKIDWAEGDLCHFYDTEGQYYGGHIVKANPVNCKVLVTEGRSNAINARFRVHRSALLEGHRLHKSLQSKHSSTEPSM